MIWGVLIGTYSSIFIAVPILLLLKFNRETITGSDEDEAEGEDAAATPSGDAQGA